MNVNHLIFQTDVQNELVCCTNLNLIQTGSLYSKFLSFLKEVNQLQFILF